MLASQTLAMLDTETGEVVRASALGIDRHRSDWAHAVVFEAAGRNGDRLPGGGRHKDSRCRTRKQNMIAATPS
jgi:hypothetical protein